MLTAAASVLLDYERTGAEERERTVPKTLPLTSAQYLTLLLQYIRQHTVTSAVNDTAKPLGSGHVFENLHPDLGYW